MTRLTAVLTGGALAFFGAASPAAAGVAGFGWVNNLACGGSHFETCASVNLQWSALTNTVTITVENLGDGMGGGDWIYRAIGLVGMPAGNPVVDPQPQNGWNPEPPDPLHGLPQETFAYVSPHPQDGLKRGDGSLTFTFTFQQLLTAADLASLGVGFHGISGPEECSTKLAVVNGQPTQQGPYDEECVPFNVVPEPLTMALLGTGLAGIAGVAHRRRREDEEAEEV